MEQASPEEEIMEEIGLRTLTKLGCKSAPPLINYKRETQNDHGHVPGGFIVYLVTAELPGIRLRLDDYWAFSKEKRQEIREAFEDTYKYVLPILRYGSDLFNSTIAHHTVISRDCVGRGITPVAGGLGSSLLSDEIQKKM
jgi:hypothetical protein